MNLTSVFSRNEDLFSFISRPWYKEDILRRSGVRTARDRGAFKKENKVEGNSV